MFNSILLNNFWGEIEMNAAGAATAVAAPGSASATLNGRIVKK